MTLCRDHRDGELRGEERRRDETRERDWIAMSV